MDKDCVFAKLGIQRRVEDPRCKHNRAANYAVGFDNQVCSRGRVSQKLKYSKNHFALPIRDFPNSCSCRHIHVYRTYHQYFWFCRSWYWWWLGLYQLQYPFHWWLEIWPISVPFAICLSVWCRFVCLFCQGRERIGGWTIIFLCRSFFVRTIIDLRFWDRVTHSLFLSSLFLKSRHTLSFFTYIAKISRG